MVTEDELHELVKNDPERAWPLVLAFVRDNPGSLTSYDLIEDFVYEHDEQFIDRIEAAALHDPVVREVVEHAHVGGFATVGPERFHLLQDRLRCRGADGR